MKSSGEWDKVDPKDAKIMTLTIEVNKTKVGSYWPEHVSMIGECDVGDSNEREIKTKTDVNVKWNCQRRNCYPNCQRRKKLDLRPSIKADDDAN